MNAASAEDVSVLASVPIREGALLEVMAEVVNACNGCLGEFGFWTEVVGEGQRARFVLLKVPGRDPSP